MQWPGIAGSASVKVVEISVNGCVGDTVTKLITISSSVPDSLAFDKDTVFYEAAGGLDSIIVLSNRSWVLTDTASWLSVVPSSGNGTTSVTLLAATNLSTVERYAVVNGVAGSKSKSFIVAQKGSASGINEWRKMNSITIYPNPTEGLFTIENKSNASYHVFVSDITGKQIDSFNISANHSETKDYNLLQSGMYVVHIAGSDEMQTLKLIIKK